jgi:hypothetical protein
MRKIKITEEQRQYALKEGITLNADVDAAGGDVKKAVDTTKQQAQKSGVDVKKVTIQIPPSNESRIITKKQMMENRLKIFKKNSDYYQLNEFVKRLGKKVNEDLTNTQIRNITGIYDDDILNASVEAEKKEELESNIWKLMVSLAGGNPRKNPFDFNELARELKSKFGFVYKGNDDNNECHIFSDGKGELVIYPTTYYPRMGKLTIYNMHYN